MEFYKLYLGILGVMNISSLFLLNSLKKKENFQSGGGLSFSGIEQYIENKYNTLTDILGSSSLIETTKDGIFESATWQVPLDVDAMEYGKYNGLDYIKIHGKPAKKHHPFEAPVYLIAGKYVKVPEHLYGPLSYASETINIHKLFVPKSEQDKYIDDSKAAKSRTLSLVTGSCGSVTISTITVQFVIDMIEQYKTCTGIAIEYYDLFRKEYDERIKNYLCGKGLGPNMEWFDPSHYGESVLEPGAVPESRKAKCESFNSVVYDKNHNKLKGSEIECKKRA
uniref:Uncharacterized protein n=1 Tax=Megaviridae environmental sample TaxID=1737588 RepID=A0A5J6VJJ8_9VIRU|nr:MAG: hypothetical protein [Megaviridae environmental sample]